MEWATDHIGFDPLLTRYARKIYISSPVTLTIGL